MLIYNLTLHRHLLYLFFFFVSRFKFSQRLRRPFLLPLHMLLNITLIGYKENIGTQYSKFMSAKV